LAGRTPGRALAGIQLVARDGTPPTVSQALLREGAPAVRQLTTDAVLRLAVADDRLVRQLARLATAFAAPPLVLLDRERRTLGDRLAGTRLIVVRFERDRGAASDARRRDALSLRLRRRVEAARLALHRPGTERLRL